MATKTLVLRPTYSTPILGGSTVPSVAQREEYLLLNEELPDDDATYIYFTSSGIAGARIGFTVPPEYTHITPYAINVIIRTNTTHDANSKIVPEVRYSSADGQTINLTPIVNNLGVYETYTLEAPDPSALWNQILTYQDSLILGVTTLESGDKVTMEIRYTQVYIEVYYREGIEFYIKQNNNWRQGNTIYTKQNGSWIECDENTLTNGTQYRVTHIT